MSDNTVYSGQRVFGARALQGRKRIPQVQQLLQAKFFCNGLHAPGCAVFFVAAVVRQDQLKRRAINAAKITR